MTGAKNSFDGAISLAGRQHAFNPADRPSPASSPNQQNARPRRVQSSRATGIGAGQTCTRAESSTTQTPTNATTRTWAAAPRAAQTSSASAAIG